jgi:hypothetical protein
MKGVREHALKRIGDHSPSYGIRRQAKVVRAASGNGLNRGYSRRLNNK